MRPRDRAASVIAAIALGFLIALLCTCPGARHPEPPPAAVLVDPELRLLVTPSDEGHRPFIEAIDGARTSIDLAMFHLTDPEVTGALVRAAARGVRVRVIVDGRGLKPHGNRAAFDELASGGVEIRGSSPAFSLTHEKAMVVDGDTAFITAINLTRDADRTRDLGIVTHRRGVVDDVDALFAADWHNAETRGHDTPVLREPSLVVSPGSRARLVALIGSAHRELLVTVENLGDPEIGSALATAAHHGVVVRVIVPSCDKNPNPLYTLPAAQALAAAGADVRMMPSPETREQPYMHSKMILADGATAYVGSINFSVNSLAKARELGIIFANPAAAARIRSIFDADWTHGVFPPAVRPEHCTDVVGESPTD